MSTSAIKKAVRIVGTQSALANHLGVSPGLVWQWINGRRQVDPRHCLPIETATRGEVTPHELRPDVFGPSPVSETRAA